MRKFLLASTALVAGAVIAAAASATPVSIDFATGPLGNLGKVHSWTDGDVTLTATAFGPGSPDLFVKNQGPDEAGLGLTNSRFHDDEITNRSWVQIQFVPTLTSLSFTASSTDPHDRWGLYGSDVSGTLGRFLVSGDSDAPTDLTAFLGKYVDLNFTALLPLDSGSNDTVLMAGFTGSVTSAVPEPASLALLAGALAFFGLRRRRHDAVLGVPA